MKWRTRADGREYCRHRGYGLRMHHAPTGWIISRENGVNGWLFVAGDVRREVAISKARAVLSE